MGVKRQTKGLPQAWAPLGPGLCLPGDKFPNLGSQQTTFYFSSKKTALHYL